MGGLTSLSPPVGTTGLCSLSPHRPALPREEPGRAESGRGLRGQRWAHTWAPSNQYMEVLVIGDCHQNNLIWGPHWGAGSGARTDSPLGPGLRRGPAWSPGGGQKREDSAESEPTGGPGRAQPLWRGWGLGAGALGEGEGWVEGLTPRVLRPRRRRRLLCPAQRSAPSRNLRSGCL